jgi:hypothetical protein
MGLAEADPTPNKSKNPDAARPNLRVIAFMVRLFSPKAQQGACPLAPGRPVVQLRGLSEE